MQTVANRVTRSPGPACHDTGAPAFAEVRGGLGAAWTGSRHEGMLFVAVAHVPDGHYGDDAIDRMVEAGDLVAYADAEGLYPASAIGPDAAGELFRAGASEVRDAIESGRPIAPALLPLTAALCGRAAPEQGADFASFGRLWALAEYAKGNRCLRDLDPGAVARDAYNDVLLAEGPIGAPVETPALRRLH